MKNATLCRIIALSCLSIVCLVAEASASIGVGSIIKIHNGPGGPGGEFGIEDLAAPGVIDFITYCVEKNEYINFTAPFYVESIASYANLGGIGGPTNDPVDPRTAWLYYNYRQGTLANYDYGPITDTDTSRAMSANALQNAAWYLEEEQSSPVTGQDYVDAADAEYQSYLNDPGYFGNMEAAIANVRIMNLRWNDENGNLAQSLLFSIPEPGTIAIWSVLGMIGLVGYFRRT